MAIIRCHPRGDKGRGPWRAAQLLPRRARHAGDDGVLWAEGARSAQGRRDGRGLGGVGRGGQRGRAARQGLGLPRGRHRRRAREMRLRDARARLRRWHRLQGRKGSAAGARAQLPERRGRLLRQRGRRDPRCAARAHEPVRPRRHLRPDLGIQRDRAVSPEEPARGAREPPEGAGHDRLRLEGPLRRGARHAGQAARAGQAEVPRVGGAGTGECAARIDRPPPGKELRKAARQTMIDLYTWPTPNGHKIHIMLEETGLEYRVHPIDIGAGDQFKPEFLALSPNNKIPAMVDQNGPDGKPFALAESGAMLFYLASKTGKFLPKDIKKRWQVMQWVMTQMGHVGPMLGQAHHFLGYAPEKIEYAMNRYKNEANRLYGVLDRQLAKSEWLACDEYTIADMATMPWLRAPERQGVNIDDYPHVKRWRDRIAERPAVKKAVEVLAERRRQTPGFSKEQAEVLFGAKQYTRR